MKPCNTCPFLKNSTNFGCREWLIDVAKLVLMKKTDSHTCHKTDPNADGYVKGNGKKMCDGIKMIAVNENLNVHIHKEVPKNFYSFFKEYAQKMKIIGEIK